jgi:hypothetical protein
MVNADFGSRFVTDRETLARIDQARKADGAGAGWSVAWRAALKPMYIDIRDRRIKEKKDQGAKAENTNGILRANVTVASKEYIRHTNLPMLKGATIDEASKQATLGSLTTSDLNKDVEFISKSRFRGVGGDLCVTLIRDNPVSCAARIIGNLFAGIAHAISGSLVLNVDSKIKDSTRIDQSGNITEESASVIAHIKNQSQVDKHEAANCFIDAGLAVVDLIKFPLALLKGVCTTIGYGVADIVDKSKNTLDPNVIANKADLPN